MTCWKIHPVLRGDTSSWLEFSSVMVVFGGVDGMGTLPKFNMVLFLKLVPKGKKLVVKDTKGGFSAQLYGDYHKHQLAFVRIPINQPVFHGMSQGF